MEAGSEVGIDDAGSVSCVEAAIREGNKVHSLLMWLRSIVVHKLSGCELHAGREGGLRWGGDLPKEIYENDIGSTVQNIAPASGSFRYKGNERRKGKGNRQAMPVS
jgi:hypothetical protein